MYDRYTTYIVVSSISSRKLVHP